MAALEFPNSPTPGQQFLAANGVNYTWDGAVWTVPPGSGGGGGSDTLWRDDIGADALTPATATRTIALNQDEGVIIRSEDYPTVDRKTGISADSQLLLVKGGAAGILFKNQDDANVLAQLDQSGNWLPNSYGLASTPRTLTAGANHNVNPGSFGIVSLSSASGLATVSGFSGGIPGRVLLVTVTGTNSVQLANVDAGSTASNRIQLKAGQPYSGVGPPIPAGGSMLLVYNNSLNRWQALTP